MFFKKGFALLFSLKKKLNDSSWWLFNLARGYHHVGMMTEAAHFYVKCLETRNTEKVTEDADTRERNAVEREAAFNLHLIYKKSGNSLAAIKVLQEYLTF
jgi:general transcription factor 3C polypeptide 3 (transcription factor C subunit 4)